MSQTAHQTPVLFREVNHNRCSFSMKRSFSWLHVDVGNYMVIDLFGDTGPDGTVSVTATRRGITYYSLLM